MTSSYLEMRAIVPSSQSRDAFRLGKLTDSAALAPAAEAVARHRVAEPCPDSDQLLLDACSRSNDDGAFLCLRCHVSHPLEGKIRAIHKRFGRTKELDLIAMASYALDDDARPLQFNHLRTLPNSCITPFTAQVICSYEPGHGAGLSHWATIKLQAHNGLKAYLREHGLLQQSEWSLLANSSRRRLQEAMGLFGVSGLSSDRALDLHAAYGDAYQGAKAEHLSRTGSQSGWLPSDAFLQRMAPQQPPDTTRQQLSAMASAIRKLLTKQWQYSLDALEAREGSFELMDPATTEDVLSEAAAASSQELMDVIATAIHRAAAPAVEAAIRADQRRWAKDPQRQRCWQLYGQGLGQRTIAEQCGHQQGWVSKLLNEKQLSSTIATAAAVELSRHSAFAAVAHSVEGAERLVGALRNHLVNPEREGDVTPLRQAVAEALTTTLP